MPGQVSLRYDTYLQVSSFKRMNSMGSAVAAHLPSRDVADERSGGPLRAYR
jgi:hypothetical protein